MVTVDEGPIDVPGEHPVAATKLVKYRAAPDEFEMYNVTQDPMELQNLSGTSANAAMEANLAGLLVEQTKLKRLRPVSGTVPGQPY